MVSQFEAVGVGALMWMCLALDCNCLGQIAGVGQAPKDREIANASRDENGLYSLVSQRLTLITDIPLDDELRSWPGLLEQSIQQWCVFFGVDSGSMSDWRIRAVLMKDRDRFAKLGLLDGVPAFDEGYQFGNELYVREQPTVYYRRHLFLHEATHWIIWKLYGGGGSPWFMEGMAEMHGTHSLRDGALQLGAIPASRELVAGWGRLRLINESLKQAKAPSLSQIFAFGNAREDHENRYAWSWAACIFFTHHPRYGPILKELYSDGKLDYSNSLSLRFRTKLDPGWDLVQREWNAFVSDLDFGYDFSKSALIETAIEEFDTTGNAWQQRLPVRMPLATHRGWQQTGVVVQSGKPIRVSCSGSYEIKESLGTSAERWTIEPCGITYQYYRGNPLGCVLGSIVSDDPEESTKRWETFRVGEGTVIDASKPGKLFLKVNEPSSGLADNQGNLSVEIALVEP